uniref:NAC domain-containing protein 19-like isoform X1 n=1 Tax=Tanacetum cinerariifolium TaxID=118510 RepID=A0A6L2J0T4_TANCI|nr:NAC domain-containing protein 19-like isoform X1 [Tanacetum cinerariifolium]
MEDSDSIIPNPNPNPNLSLPPGCQFFPSEQQLITHYLTLKNNHSPSQNLITEIDLYRYEPFNLPESACFVFGREGKKKHWYCFEKMGRVKRGRGEMRRAGGGYWKRSGSAKDIVCGGVEGVVIGVRKCFVFYLGEFGVGKGGVRTKWIMYEYSLVDHKMAEASYVLCRVFAKSHHRCNISNNVLKSCHENPQTVRHVGIHCDDTPGPVISGSGRIKRSSIDSAENNGSKKICTSGKISDGPPAAVQENTMDFEGDFLELNDLLCEVDNIVTRLVYQDLPCGFDRHFCCHGRESIVIHGKTGHVMAKPVRIRCFILSVLFRLWKTECWRLFLGSLITLVYLEVCRKVFFGYTISRARAV